MSGTSPFIGKINILVDPDTKTYRQMYPETESKQVKNLTSYIYDALGGREKNTVYSVDDVVYHPALKNGKFLLCTTAGTTSNSDLTISTTAVDTTINDGTVVWTIKNPVTSGGGLQIVELTQAEYDALTTEEKNDINILYVITDAPSSVGIASAIHMAGYAKPYSSSAIDTTDTVLTAIGKLEAQITNLVRQPSTTYAVGDIVYFNGLINGKKLVCVKAGTTASTQLVPSTVAEGAIIADGSVTWAIDSYAGGNYTAAKQNSQYRGADISAYFTSGIMSTNIANGVFVNIYPGDYIVKSVTIAGTAYNNVKWIIGDCDYNYQKGDTACTAHHVLIFPQTALGTSYMNSSNVTTGAYIGSYMWTTTIPKYATGIVNAFGSSHIIQGFRELLTDTINASAASSAGAGYTGTSNHYVWTSVTTNLFSEAMVYGAPIWASSAYDHFSGYHQVAAFRHDAYLLYAREFIPSHMWLRTVVSGTFFAIVNYYGHANGRGASVANGVRPYSLLT